jgi:uncharacterized protein (DUF488 family)
MNKAKPKGPIFTIGYQGASVPAFIAALRKASVVLVLDIRAAPVSRKKGFSKNPLAQHLSEAGIGIGISADSARRNRGARLPAQATTNPSSAFFGTSWKSLKCCSTWVKP